VLIIRRSKLYYAASGIVTPVGSRPVHRLREDCTGFVIPDCCIIIIKFYLGVLVMMYLFCLFCITNFYVLLTVHLSVILVINQLDEQNFVL